MSSALKTIHTHGFDFWLARGSVVIVVVLQSLIINKLTVGPRWLAPAAELALLIPLSFATAWTQNWVRNAQTDHHWGLIAKNRRRIRAAAISLTALITLMNLGSLLQLVIALVGGKAGANGQTLLLDAVNIWVTNTIAFALWFWSIDRGGPAAASVVGKETNDFLFPQMTSGVAAASWTPGFIDYLFLSFTNATAFSPTDTMPLSGRAKMLMMVESSVSLLTLALVAARAVNILG